MTERIALLEEKLSGGKELLTSFHPPVPTLLLLSPRNIDRIPLTY